MTSGAWTRGEMLAAAASRLVEDGDVVVVGLGLPQVVALLAKRTHAPAATLLLELGVFEPAPRGAAVGIADPRMWQGAAAFGSLLDVLGFMLQGGRVTLGVLGALQVDGDGSINATLVVGKDGQARRFQGAGGGANDIASLAGRFLVVMRHEARRFKSAVDFITGPGRRVRGRARAAVGLPGSGAAAIVTDRAVFAVTAGGAVLRSVHPKETLAGVLADTPMPVATPSGVGETPPPRVEELALLREELDPHGWYTR